LRGFGPIVLTRGMATDTSLWDWYHNIVTGIPDRRDGSVFLMNEIGVDIFEWDFTAAWPNTITGPSMDASANAVALEVLTLVVESITLKVLTTS
jgi:phage tail-like protein